MVKSESLFNLGEINSNKGLSVDHTYNFLNFNVIKFVILLNYCGRLGCNATHTFSTFFDWII